MMLQHVYLCSLCLSLTRNEGVTGASIRPATSYKLLNLHCYSRAVYEGKNYKTQILHTSSLTKLTRKTYTRLFKVGVFPAVEVSPALMWTDSAFIVLVPNEPVPLVKALLQTLPAAHSVVREASLS